MVPSPAQQTSAHDRGQGTKRSGHAAARGRLSQAQFEAGARTCSSHSATWSGGIIHVRVDPPPPGSWHWTHLSVG